MAVLEIRFLSGQYHATAWGRNVNEGEPEWPPSPHRLARALLDIWYRRHPDISEDEVKVALHLLAGELRMSLPATTSMVVKQYLDQNKTNSDKQPVLDAFVCMEKGACVFIELPSEASDTSLNILALLSEELNYLGRSESWVAVSVEASLPKGVDWNCNPSAEGNVVNTLLPEDEFLDLPYLPKVGKSKGGRDSTWMETLAFSTPTLQEQGWNRHPLLSRSHYTIMPRKARRSQIGNRYDEGLFVTYALHAKPLPPITEAVTYAERIRAGLMSRHRRICGGDEARVSSLFSGKSTDGKPLKGHPHAFYWPCDLDDDGKIDHIRVFLPRFVKSDERRALETLRKLWLGREDLGELVFLSAVPVSQFSMATEFISATPVVFSRHYKTNKGSFAEWIEGEVRRSCVELGLPEPVSVIPERALCVGDGRSLEWASFRRGRKGSPTLQGYGFRLLFEKPICASFALGSLAHFGLGVFKKA